MQRALVGNGRGWRVDARDRAANRPGQGETNRAGPAGVGIEARAASRHGIGDDHAAGWQRGIESARNAEADQPGVAVRRFLAVAQRGRQRGRNRGAQRGGQRDRNRGGERGGERMVEGIAAQAAQRGGVWPVQQPRLEGHAGDDEPARRIGIGAVHGICHMPHGMRPAKSLATAASAELPRPPRLPGSPGSPGLARLPGLPRLR